MEHDEQADQVERDLDEMEERSEELGKEIEETEADWERKKQDDSVPGALPDEDGDGDS